MDFSVATLLVVLLCTVEHITSTNTYDDRHPGFMFDNHPGYILFLPINTEFRQMSTKVSSKMDCVFACVGKPWCRSINFKITAEKDGRHICEMIGTDNYTNPKHLTPDEKFTHLNIKNPCEAKPCLNKGKCLPHENRLDYRCRCKDGYTGEKCQHDVDECAAKPCDANAACNNTEGSYRCTCNMGYHGDGKQCTPYAYRGLDSSAILSSYGNADYLRTLAGFLYPVLQSSSRSRWIRCWRAATDGWDVRTTFHPRCDGQGPMATVTIVRVGSYVFGGYSDISWHSGNHYSTSSRCFLYSLYNTRGYNPVKLTVYRNSQYGIYGGSTYGPTFGGGHDLYISNYASTYSNHSYTYPYSYNPPPGCPRSHYCSFFAGHSPFTPSDVEVFYEITS